MSQTVVVGAGMAGMVAALRLAHAGRRPVVVAKGLGCTHLSGGTIDVLGYGAVPVRSGHAGQLVERPGEELTGFVASHPDHPYARVGPDGVAEAVAWFLEHVVPGDYEGSLETNMVLPTAVGAPKPACLVPRSMIAGDLRQGARLVLVGLAQLRDFHAPLAAANLATLPGVSARAVQLDLPTGEADLSPLAVARRLDDAVFRRETAGRLAAMLEPGETVGLPAVLGVTDPSGVRAELEDRLGCPVFEIPTLPPSVPGVRLFTLLRAAVTRAGGSLVIGSSVVGAEVADGRIGAVHVETSGGVRTWPARSVVLASGGWLAGGLEMDSHGEVRETVFGLPVSGVPGPEGRRFEPGYFGSHAMAMAGLAVDDRLRPMDGEGRVVLANLHVAGATLAGAEPWREKSGDGISVATGYRAAGAILEGAA